jgi:chitin disaccharide deacetylase
MTLTTKPLVILCADDYAITGGVSTAIDQLIAAGRLSATSAIVTGPHWPALAPSLAAHWPRSGLGLHINLTLGQPLAPMPLLAPEGALPAVGVVTRKALTGTLSAPAAVAEIAGEISRQIAAFTQGTGFQPDFIDGHQHVHALPGVRSALLSALASVRWTAPPLVRDPADGALAIARRGVARLKAASVGALAAGFGATIRNAGFPTNRGFAGFSDFTLGTDYAAELEKCFTERGARPLVMCHPGFPDAELAALDPLTERRREEFDGLLRAPWLPAALWQPDRSRRDLWGTP